jgi:hypothetical protein
MGGKSKSKSSSGGYQAVGKATQAGASKALGGLMEKQSGFLGQMLGPLVEHGQAMMANNPGLQNFVSKMGTAPGQKQFDDLGLLLGLKRPEEEAAAPAAAPANPNGLTDEQLAQLQRSGFGYGNFNINTPYNINDDMRNRFNR